MAKKVVAKCKWGHDTPDQDEQGEDEQGTKLVLPMLCPLCLVDPDPMIVVNAGRLMHPDRYALWLSKQVM